jgi:hypothetical protein
MTKFASTRTVPAVFRKLGDLVDGTVLSIEDAIVPEFNGRKIVGPKIGLDGQPVTQKDITLDVDGVHTLMHTRGGIEYAIGTALDGADLNVGDRLSVKFVATEDMGEGLDPAKVFEVKIAHAAN